MNQPISPMISAVVCTHNRERLLAGALESLREQSLDHGLYEILVVDNGSTDSTREVVEGCQAAPPVRYIAEPRLGLSYARNTGMIQAAAPYAAYLDDDARADPGWLEALLNAFETSNPRPLAAGGPIAPFYETPKPTWFRDAYESFQLGDEARRLKPGESLFGSNMAFQREAVLAYGGFDVRYGMAGGRLSLGEETALFLEMWRREGDGLVLYYTPQAVVRHLVPARKMRVAYRLRWAYLSGRIEMQLRNPQAPGWRLGWLAGTPFEVARTGLKALLALPRYRHWQRWMVDYFSPLAARLGSSAGLLR